MKTLIVAITAAFLLLVTVPADAQVIRLPETRTVELENGLRIVLAEMHSLPLISAHLRIPAGAVAEPRDREGLATFAAALLTQGTRTRSAQEIAAALDRMGATLDATATRDDLRLGLSVMTRHQKEALALLADCVIDPTFPSAEVERIRTRLLAMLSQIAEDPDALADNALWQTEFGDDPYGRRLDGGQASLSAITAEDLVQFHRRFVVPAGSVLVVVGDFAPATMEEELRRLFTPWSGEPPASSVPAVGPTAGPQVLLVHKPDLEQSQIRLGYRGLPRGHADESALIIATTILGGGFTSRLLEAIRVERSLSYSAHARLFQDGRAGMVRVSTFTKAQTTRETIDVALEEIRKLGTSGPTQEELERTVSFISGFVARGQQSPSDIAESLAMVTFYDLPADYIAQRVARLRGVSTEGARQAAETYLAPEHMNLVVVADKSLVQEQIEGLGPVREMDFGQLIE
jgi:zinc protease